MHKEVTQNEIVDLLKRLDKRLLTQFYSFKQPPQKFNLVAIGGTALEILGLKKISKDIYLLSYHQFTIFVEQRAPFSLLSDCKDS